MKLLVLLSRVPFPLDKGDKLRAYHFIRYLSEFHDIYLFCLNDNNYSEDDIKAIQPFCKNIKVVRLNKLQIVISLFKAAFTKLPFQVAYFYNHKIQRDLDKYISDIHPDHIFCQLVRMAEYVKTQAVPKTIDYQDVFSYGIKRRTEIADFYMKPLFNSEYKRLINYEKEVFDAFDNKIIISITDRDLIQHPLKDEIVIIPNGVDFSYYQPIKCEKEFDIVFTGNMGYPPNIDAAIFLINEIKPLVAKVYKDIKIVIAGANPHSDVKALKSDQVIVTGWVDDIRSYYARSVIFIAPMRIGTGLQNKLLEAMAMGIPSVTTSLSNSALNAKEGEEILVGNSAEELAACIIRLLADRKLRDDISKNASGFVKNKFHWEENIKKLNQLITN